MLLVDLVRVASLWEENQEFLKQRLGHSSESAFGARWVLMPSVPYPRFNHISRIRLAPERVDALVESGRAFFRRHGLPTSCLMVTPATAPPDLEARLYRMGFTSDANPVMIWNGQPVAAPNREVRVERTVSVQAPVVFELMRQVFFPGAAEGTLALGYRGVAVSYDIGATHYLAYLGQRPVGVGTLFPYGEMAGIYNMCTLPGYRGRGVARAILAACLADAKAAGCSLVGLTPTSMGRPLYEKVGFTEVYRELYFVERLD